MPKSRGFKLVGTEDQVNQALTKIIDDCEYYCAMKNEEEYVLLWQYKNQRSDSAIKKLVKSDVSIVNSVGSERIVLEETMEIIKEEGRLPKPKSGTIDDETWHMLLEMDSYIEAVDWLEKNRLAAYVHSRQSINSFLASKFYESDARMHELDEFLVDPIENLDKKVAWIIGPPGIGKTQFALAHFKHPLLVSCIEDYRYFNDRIDGIVVDDGGSNNWQGRTLLEFCNLEKPITKAPKYTSITIPKGMPRMIVANDVDLIIPKGIHEQELLSIASRVQVYEYTEKMYDGTSHRDDIHSGSRKHIIDRKDEFISKHDNEYVLTENGATVKRFRSQ